MTTKRSRFQGILRPARARQLAVGALLVVAVAACQSNNIPSSYGDVSKVSYMGTCTGSGVTAANGTTTSLSSTPLCQCSYQVFVDQVPFNDDAAKDPKFAAYEAANYHPTYVQLDKDLKDDPTKMNQLPDPVQTALKTCTSAKEIITPGSTPGTTPGGPGGSTSGTSVGTTPRGSTVGSTPGAGSTP